MLPFAAHVRTTNTALTKLVNVFITIEWSRTVIRNVLTYDNIKSCAARFVTRNYSYETGSMTGILEESKWETLQKRR